MARTSTISTDADTDATMRGSVMVRNTRLADADK
jgi:hypothetical protein